MTGRTDRRAATHGQEATHGRTTPGQTTPGADPAAIRLQATVEDLLVRGVCTRDEAEAEAVRLLREDRSAPGA